MNQPGIFTGERLVAGDPLFAADLARHLAAYRFAQEQVRGKSVLDAGCGDGYGTDLLAQTAARALGVDRNQGTVEVAQQRYQRSNLRYRACALESLSELGERFDVVCNFQVIEHLDDPQPFLRQVRQVLAPHGRLIVTTPNRDMTVIEIPFHVHEYTGEELRSTLRFFFDQVELKGVLPNERASAFERARVANATRILRLDPFNLRRFVPPALIELIYPRLAKIVRRRIQSQQTDAHLITADDFSIGDRLEGALDLLAICRATEDGTPPEYRAREGRGEVGEK